MWGMGADVPITAGEIDTRREEFIAGMREAVDQLAERKPWHLSDTPPDKKVRLRWRLLLDVYEEEET